MKEPYIILAEKLKPDNIFRVGKNEYEKSIFIIILLICIINFSSNNIVHSKGIILAEDQIILETFKSRDQQDIKKLAESLFEYEEVILHLGNKKVFTRRHPFFYKTSIENLKLFADQLDEQGQEFYIWFLDSFGSESSLDIYKNYQEIVEANLDKLDKLI